MRMYPLFDPGERALRSEATVVRRKFAEPGIAASCQGKVPGEKCPLFARPPIGKLTVPWPLTSQ
jgi:hypothetical protein